MKKFSKKFLLITALLVGLGACSRSTPPTTLPPTPRPVPSLPGVSGTVGNETAKGAVEQFLAAVRAEDLQAMSIIWGTERGPARDHMPRDEMEKREIILVCYMQHDNYRILREGSGDGGRRVMDLELTNGPLTRTTTIHTIRGPRGRWFVEKMDIAAVRDFCNQGS